METNLQLTPAWTKFKPHAGQDALWHSKARFIVLPCGRRCLEAGTLVATPQGPRAIEDLRVGDNVFGFENGWAEITQVEAVWDNGIQEVLPVGNAYHKYLAGTQSHKLWAANERYLKEEDYSRIEITKLNKYKRVRRLYLFDMIQGGAIRQERAYSLGCMLGNGCCRENRITIGKRVKHLYISAPNDIVPKRMAQELGCEFYRQHETNYSWKLAYAYGKIPYYEEWCKGRYSHEKIADWSIIDTWDKASCLAFLSGIIDTDGCIRYKSSDNNQIVIQIAMQAKSVVDCCQKIVFKYFQELKPILTDNRDKYVHGSVYILNITDNLIVKRILEAIEPYSVKRIDYSVIKPRNYRDDRIGIYPIDKPYLAQTHDITVANSTNLYILHDGGIVTSNSGKSAIAKRKLVLSALNPDSGYPDANYFAAAPVQQQAERIYWKDLIKLIPKNLIVKISKSEHSIELYNGATIYVFGMDKPERMEGTPWNGGILDEYANMKPQAWVENVRPALADRNGWCWLIGVPEGRNHYYDLYQFACDPKNQPEWAAFTWKSSDILSPYEIESARATLDELTFQQEMEASFVTFEGRCYYPFMRETHCRPLRQLYNPKGTLAFCFDFNVDPGVAAVCQEVKLPNGLEGTAVIGEVYIERNSNTPSVCRKLIHDWGKHEGRIVCYGDATGGSRGSAKVQGSDWDLIKAEFRQSPLANKISYDVPRANPPERARVNAVNSRLKSETGDIRLMVDPEYAPHVVKDFEGVILLKGGSGEIDKKATPDLTHLVDSIGYYIIRKFPIVKQSSAMITISSSQSEYYI